ncbi:MAG: Acyl-CoA dehydrogenase [Frankiales bacterium]|nr:Acyl-CoA dehydrogenase [Frankiales bacterium]
MSTANALVLTPEHEDMRRGLRTFLQIASSETEVRRLMETADGFDAATWRRLTSEFAVTGLVVPEELGGAGFGFVELGVVMEEAGRALLVAPLLSTALATAALLASGDVEAQKSWLPGIASGDVRATVAFPPVGTTTPTVTHDSGVLTGSVSYVLDGHTASLIVVAAGTELFLVDGSAAGLTRTVLHTIDETRKLARLDLDGVATTPLAGSVDHVRDVAAVLLSLEQVGAAQKVLESTVDYVKTRNQFGRAIGSFQAVKHRCADMLVEVESARSAAYGALGALAAGDPDAPVLASIAKAFCSDAFVACAGDSIQLHGGIGFTWEHSAHLYFKRAKASQLLFGDSAHHRQKLAEHLNLR